MTLNLNLFQTYIPKFAVDLKRGNDDVIIVSSSYLSPAGDVFYVDKRTLSPVLIQTTQSLRELNPEVSNKYPFRIVCPLDFDGSTMIQSPSINTEPTASQSYYAPIYFERFDADVIRSINRDFVELILPTPSVTQTTTSTGTETDVGTTSTGTGTTSTGTGTTSTGTGTTSSQVKIVTVKIDESYARFQASGNNIVWDDFRHTPTVDGGWAIMLKNSTYDDIFNGYKNGVYNSTLAREGVRLMLRPRREYENQLTAAEKALIIG